MILFVYCAGALGKEVIDMAEEMNGEQKRWDEIRFVADIYEDDYFYGHKVMSFEETLKCASQQDVEVVIANGEPEARNQLYAKCKRHDLRIATLVHPLANISPSATIGEGTVIRKFTTVSSDAVIKENVYIQPYVGIGHDAEIGANSVISSFAAIPGYCKIGDCVYIASGAILNNKIHVGNYAIIGMGAMVFRNVKEGKIIMGNPGKVIGENVEKTVFHRF
jgi:sugar O-acyltransferase (sialic acid O-acetyltransferase NeuD family)